MRKCKKRLTTWYRPAPPVWVLPQNVRYVSLVLAEDGSHKINPVQLQISEQGTNTNA